MTALDVAGERYGRLVALQRAPNNGRQTVWRFRCDCGEEIEAGLRHVRSGRTRSCGCLNSEAAAARRLRHGHGIGRRTRTFRSWDAAKQRCFNPNDAHYERYGGRGITMCAAWRDDFAVFLADMGECPPGLTIDRIDNDGDYRPGNCRWATLQEQARNRGKRA